VFGFPIDAESDMTLEALLLLDLDRYSEAILDVCDRGAEEFALEMAYERMNAEWRDMTLQFSYKKSKDEDAAPNQPLASLNHNEIVAASEAHLFEVEKMRLSPNVGFMEMKVQIWSAQLHGVHGVMAEWSKVQEKISLLSPLFLSEAMLRCARDLCQRYSAIELSWLKILQAAARVPAVLTVVSAEALQQTLTELNEDLQRGEDALDPFLDLKCGLFSRFWFLRCVISFFVSCRLGHVSRMGPCCCIFLGPKMS
jgi:hypothetical protein